MFYFFAVFSFFLKRHHSVCQNKYFLGKQTFVCTEWERRKANFPSDDVRMCLRRHRCETQIHFQTHFKAERRCEWAEEAILIFWLKNRDKTLRSCFTFYISYFGWCASHPFRPLTLELRFSSSKSALFCWAVRMMKAKNHFRQPPNPFLLFLPAFPGRRTRQSRTSDQVIVDKTMEPRTLDAST